MKTFKIFLATFVMLAFVISSNSYKAYSQCTPADSTECPDPENNGEICPDSLPVAIAGQFYDQVVTILPPPTVGDSIVLDLHHLELIGVEDLPPGIGWVSNSPTNEFMAGTYYCILLDGIPVDSGKYYLKIIVDVYAYVTPSLFMLVDQHVDSTSLAIEVKDPFGMPEYTGKNFFIKNNQPNPFQSLTRIDFFSAGPEQVCFEVYSLLGELVHREYTDAVTGENQLTFDGGFLNRGTYFFVLKTDKSKATGLMVRSD